MPWFIPKLQNKDHPPEDQDMYVFMNNAVQAEVKFLTPRILNLAV